ncbi:toprim domain-containing protein [Nocardia cyriacigeorgica]|uniref:toprim domain-containing protein n=1 Tax=Nocardia cyriacigeorgica TaxID=135487 RepID=UPI001892D98D|nr:toprim domain-containing protein [Nocardia cyriacigeorgica]MBF6162994.1 toprim domain-containing protein [Nocardia cyriacigeorgica]MBF6201973.1 toprim domain-containing protein [Nocardia cyriacigeorgica]
MSAPARTRDQGSWETITAALEKAVGPGRPSGAWTKYCCPAHEGDGRHHKPSLGVKYDSGEQRTVVRCFAGCDNEQVLETIGLQVRDMFDRRLERTSERGRRANRPRPQQLSRADRALKAAGLPAKQPTKPDIGAQTTPWRVTATYPYMRADGTVAGEVVRREADFTGGRDKQFHQRRWDPQSGRMVAGGFEPLPYQLPQVLATIADGGVIYICEGEKDVAAAESAGLTATTNAGGAMVWSAEHAKWLKGAHTVVIVADHDTAGYRRAERVMGTLAGLVGRVRVVQAATGKDLHDHLQCGHEIAELVPIPYLDPYTPGRTGAPATSTPAAETSKVSAAASEIPTPGGNPAMAEYLLAPSTDAPAQHSDEVDNIGAQWAMFMRLLMGHILERARVQAEIRRQLAERAAHEEEAARQEAEARQAAERAAAEALLRKIREVGFDNASRTQLAEAIGEAAAWADESPVARQALAELNTHVQQRYGITLDVNTGQVTTVAGPEVADALAAAESERAALARLRKAQDRMVQMVAAQELDESVKAELYADIEQWRANPSARQLDQLTKKLADKGVGEEVRTRVRFVASYLGQPHQMVPFDELGGVNTPSPTVELRKLGRALVDPGEEAKPRIDQLLTSYQDKLRLGAPTGLVREQLAAAVALLTPEEQDAARERGREIRSNPAGQYKPLWPGYVDRDELATTIRVYATLAPQAELAAGKASTLDDATAVGLQKQAARHKKAIDRALTEGKGLHAWEKDQITAVLRDVEAGKTSVPELLFADDRSAAAVDADKAARIAQDTSYAHRRQLEQILESGAAPEGTVRRTRDMVTRVMDAQTELARGGVNLPDYERTGLDRQLEAKLAAVGVPEPLRNKVRHHLDYAAGEAATAGKQANRIADRWAERTEAVAVERAPKPKTDEVGYDSPQRREGREKSLRAAGLNDDQVAQHMAADAGFAQPPSAAVRAAEKGKTRTTRPGTGVHKTHHRGKGRGPERGLGR